MINALRLVYAIFPILIGYKFPSFLNCIYTFFIHIFYESPSYIIFKSEFDSYVIVYLNDIRLWINLGTKIHCVHPIYVLILKGGKLTWSLLPVDSYHHLGKYLQEKLRVVDCETTPSEESCVLYNQNPTNMYGNILFPLVLLKTFEVVWVFHYFLMMWHYLFDS